MAKKSNLKVSESPLVVPAVTEAALADTALADTVTLDAVVAPGEPTEPAKADEPAKERAEKITLASLLGPIFHLMFPASASGKALQAAREAALNARAACENHRAEKLESMREILRDGFSQERFNAEYPGFDSTLRRVEALRVAEENLASLETTDAPNPVLVNEILRIGSAYINEAQNRKKYVAEAEALRVKLGI